MKSIVTFVRRVAVPFREIGVQRRMLSDSSSKPTKSEGILEKMRKEVLYLRQALDKAGGSQSMKKKRMTTEELRAAIQRRVDFENKTAEAAAAAAKAAENGEVPEAAEEQPFMAPVVLDGNETVWERRINNLKESLRGSAPLRAIRRAKRSIAQSENPVIASTRNIKESMEDKIEDIREAIETSQHPLVWRAVELQDKMFGETETGFALGEIKKVDPSFQVTTFLQEMEEYMIPTVVGAFLRADQLILSSVMEAESDASRVVTATIQERIARNVYWDTRILDIKRIEFEGAALVNDTPLIMLTFSCQQIHCIKDKTGKIVDGSESDIRNVFYQWVVRRDTGGEFDWKIVKMVYQHIQALV